MAASKVASSSPTSLSSISTLYIASTTSKSSPKERLPPRRLRFLTFSSSEPIRRMVFLITRFPILRPNFCPTLRPTLVPILRPILRPILLPTLRPTLRTTVRPIFPTTLRPTLRPTPFITWRTTWRIVGR
ncbi:hypothetical protein BDN70DRAFT_708761 [Pholiota conissans]|uniref:Uncharacterized protein n=1 Tax=Pholiota conissans TaxID=109636 RepID=A0A9P6D619_9AGAR|nr:hypothetical protein BDN70DRAFT_708761 [Pholiota conissans]